MIKISLEFYKTCAARTEVAAAQLSLHAFSRWKMCHLKKAEENVDYLRHHSIDFHQDLTKMIALSSHLILVTDDLENVSQG